ncbi:non-homologous end-joining DNA ligase [Legionella jordanis]|uniref:DNA ligase (ATP) n=2 Tax=Legionella jordanis TaxID=456 RepID=A0A0W0V8F0_9GAMM|nr:non-homologous end-joining DNA ligase [Legionella jordanis]KTD16362.1 DNA ligase D [Legionella jordanis]RMX04427.1 hypothetical protein EAW55_03050 [Legionella jordanis]VEH12179.1 Putative DNA ligase-like protein Rv0938/MT0965 [Legionella jordanis]
MAKSKDKKAHHSHLKPSGMPETISAQLATLVDHPPCGDDWLHEIKFDGYRILAIKCGKHAQLLSRNNKDWTDEFPSIREAISQLTVKQAIFDGELVFLDDSNRSNFQLLQNRLQTNFDLSLIYYVFDLLYYDEYDLRSLPLIKRKEILKSLLPEAAITLQYSEHILDKGEAVFQRACALSLEGIISKKINSPYMGGRAKTWLKIKCSHRQELVVGGFTPPKGGRAYFGSLYLGYFNKNKELIYCGNVGTGFTQNSLAELHHELKNCISSHNPFNSRPPGIKTATWVLPQLVVEVEFTEWTKEGRLRHPSFKGLRKDKDASEIIREKETPIEKLEQHYSIKNLTTDKN